YLKSIQPFIYDLQRGQAQPHVYADDLLQVKIPKLSNFVARKIVAEVLALDKMAKDLQEELESKKQALHDLVGNLEVSKISLGQVSSFKNGLNYSRQSVGDVVTVVGVKDFKEHFSPRYDELEKVQIDGSFSDDYQLNLNDILVVRSNGSANLVGRFLFIDEVEAKMSYSGFTIRIRVTSDSFDPKFLCHYLRTNNIRQKLTKDSKGSNIKS
ncbi:TPA: hypothetical protein RUZ96_003609, partial [Vibrio cholerae]|nr:hypothetical protein [Vibrio cholerae]